MQLQGVLRKMTAVFESPIKYYLDLADDFICLNNFIGKEIQLTKIGCQCLNCSKDKEIYRQGFCKNCFFTIPQANESVMRPELSTAHLGIEKKDLAWEIQFEIQPHIVYLALSSEVKVGVTRASQVPTRWIDQGASKAIILANTNNRYEAGMIEVALKQHIADKTNYRKMLTNDVANIDLLEEKKTQYQNIPDEFKQFYNDTDEVIMLHYPVISYPTKVNTLNLEKISSYKGVLSGLKGQYLMFEDNTVFNIRSNEGFVVQLEF